MKIKILFLLVIFLFLGACCQTKTKEYLLQHPNQLLEEATHCRSEQIKDTAYCDMVISTAESFTNLINIRASNPEHFGLEILQSQEQLAKVKTTLNHLQTTQPHDPKQIESLNQLQEELKLKILLMLAVVAETTGTN